MRDIWNGRIKRRKATAGPSNRGVTTLYIKVEEDGGEGG